MAARAGIDVSESGTPAINGKVISGVGWTEVRVQYGEKKRSRFYELWHQAGTAESEKLLLLSHTRVH